MNEPLTPTEAKQLIRRILTEGSVVISAHAEQEMDNDDLSLIDCINVLRGGWVEPGEFENGSWRYRVLTQRIAVVIAMTSDDELVIVTAWRIT